MNDLEQIVIKHEEQIKTLFTNQQKLEKVVDKIDNLTVSIAKMAVVQQDMVDEQKKLRGDVEKIKEQPVKDAHDLKMAVIKLIVTFVVSAVLGSLITMIIKG